MTKFQTSDFRNTGMIFEKYKYVDKYILINLTYYNEEIMVLAGRNPCDVSNKL